MIAGPQAGIFGHWKIEARLKTKYRHNVSKEIRGLDTPTPARILTLTPIEQYETVTDVSNI